MSERNILLSAEELGIPSAGGNPQKVANLLNGGLLGTGYDARNLDAASPLVVRNTVALVLQTPLMFDTPATPKLGQMWKCVIETQARAIQGVDFGYNVSVDESAPAGHDGQMIAVPLQTNRDAVSPSITFNELKGNLIANMALVWVNALNHADTNASMQGFDFIGEEKAWVPSVYAMTMMLIMYDEVMLPENILAACIITNMFPKNIGGQLGFGREMNNARVLERTIEFTGLVQHNQRIRQRAIELATQMQLHKAQYNSGDNLLERTATVSAVSEKLQNMGIGKSAEEAFG